MTATTIPSPGDMLVIEKSGDVYDVLEMVDHNWIPSKSDIKGIDVARIFARNRLAPSGREVWFRTESEPDTAIRPF